MKLLRVGEKSKEKVAIVDSDKSIRDLSQHVNDLDPAALMYLINFKKRS